jgi:acyl carrier protein
MADSSRIAADIASIFEERLNVAVPAHDTDLIDSGLLDSMAFVDLLLHLEEHFGIRIGPADFELDEFRSIDRIAAFIKRASGADGSRVARASNA